MSESKELGSKNSKVSTYFRFLVLFGVLLAAVYFIKRDVGFFCNVLKVIIGFGGMILVHEFGHFIVAKLSGIKVEAFSIGFPPVLAGILKTGRGYRIRILPKLFPRKGDESGEGLLSFTVGRAGKAGETEYRVGLIPAGGFVKMLGQEDTKAVEASNDPRSFANKPVLARMAVIAAGVFFNAVSAILIFMVVFLVGIKLTPAVVGGVRADSPAARAGLKAGDEIIEVAGKGGSLDFRNILMAAILSERDEKVALKVRHEDGSIEDFAIAAERMQTPRGQMRLFGIEWPMSLTIADVAESEVKELYDKTGLLPGDLIKSVNGVDVRTYWEMERVVQSSLVHEVTVLAERTDPNSKKIEHVGGRFRLALEVAEEDGGGQADLGNVCSMVPRLRVAAVLERSSSSSGGFISLLNRLGIKKEVVYPRAELKIGDIILAIGDNENPTYREMRDITEQYEDRNLPVKVLRTDANNVERELTVTVVPKRWGEKVVIGIVPEFDFEHSVVAGTVAAWGQSAAPAIPRGATITTVDGVAVSNFYDIAREISKNTGQQVTVDYRVNDEVAGAVALDLSGAGGSAGVIKTTFAEIIPFEPLQRLYKAGNPVEAIAIGCKKTAMLVVQTYVSVRRLMEGLVSQKELSGPVGIIKMSYDIAARQPLIEYVYFLGVISVLLAVFNFLPLPPFDGGLVVLLLVEKIKGSALSERTQEVIVYAGLAFIVALFIYLTFNDIVNFFR